MLAELGTNDFMPPAANQQFARVIKGQGNNLHEVEPAGTLDVSATDVDSAATEQSPPTTFLASMPLRFRNNIYVKRGTFLIIEMIPEGNKVKAEIARILMPEHVRQFKKDGIWPAKFEDEQQPQPKESEVSAKSSKRISGSDCGSSDDGSDDDSDLVKNTNGWHGNAESSSEEEDSSDDDDEDSASDDDVDDNGERAMESADIAKKTKE